VATTALEVRFAQDSDLRVDLARFNSTLERVAQSLREIDRALLVRGTRPVWVIQDLGRVGDLLSVRLTARAVSPLRRQRRSLLEPIEALVDGARQLEQTPELPQYYSDQTISRLIKIGDPAQGGLHEVSLATVNGEVGVPVHLSGQVMEHAREAVRAAEVSHGTVTGTLDILNSRARSGKVRVSIFDTFSRRGVTGWAETELGDEMRNDWGHRVAASGRLTRNERGQVVKMEIHRIERLPEDNSGRPSTDDLLGISPDWTGGRPTAEFLRGSRRG
jgi:hypothetical protein